MKLKLKKLFSILLLVGCVLSIKAQLTGVIEYNKGTEKSFQVNEVGGNLQKHYSLHYQDKITVSGSAGLKYRSTKNISNYNSVLVPLALGGRAYFIGGHRCSGGAYCEMMGGMNAIISKNQYIEEGLQQKRISFDYSAGIGYRAPMSFDFGIKVSNALIGSSRMYLVGIKFGYTF